MTFTEMQKKYDIVSKVPERDDLVFVNGIGIAKVIAVNNMKVRVKKGEQGHAFWLPPSFYKIVQEKK